MKTNPFDTFKFSPHSVGHLMSSLPGLTDVQIRDLNDLLLKQDDYRDKGKELAKTDQNKLDSLVAKANANETPDTLPQGAKTHLDDIYRGIVWKRKDIVETVYMDKGLYTEQSSLDLLSEIDGIFYKKNTATIENEWMIGTPDVWPVIKDTKSCWNLRTFDQAELTSLYEYQIKAYLWITYDSWDDETIPKNQSGELIYTLVNAPAHMVVSEISRIQYRYGVDPSSPKWLKLAQQIERNFIYDVDKFKEENPLYTFVNEDLDFSIPERYRLKRFTVTLTSDDIAAFETRLPICRQYLINKWKKDFINITVGELNIA